MLDFAEASRLGALVKVKGARCPEHGPLTPEGLVYPFTVTGEALAFMAEDEQLGTRCMARGCEGSILVDAEPTDKRLVQHLTLWHEEAWPGEKAFIGLDPDKPRVIIETPLIDGTYAIGVAVRDPERVRPEDAGL